MNKISHATIVRQDATVERDGVRLKCTLSVPDAPTPPPCVVFVHGLGSSKESPRNVVVSERLLDTGIATLLFDLSGHGGSSVDPYDGHEAFVRDLAAVFEWTRIRPELDSEKTCIAGSSLGAVVALDAVRRRLVSPAALVLRAPPIERDQLTGLEIPVLIIVGTQDLLLRQVLHAASPWQNVRVETVEGAGHLFEEPGTLEEAVQITSRWLKEELHV